MTATSPALPDREVEFESWFNFRDLGGYAGRDGRSVRNGRLFRSMTPEHASPADVARARALGIGVVIDLRGPRNRSSGPIGEAPARRVAAGPARPLMRGKKAIAEYVKMAPEDALPIVLQRMGSTFGEAAAVLADAETPALVHCRLGKDRTGVFAALILRLLGVSEDDVIGDYMLSGADMPAAHDLLREHESPEIHAMMLGSRVADEPPSRVAIERVLEVLERDFGGAEAYLRRHRLSGRRIDRLINSLLE